MAYRGDEPAPLLPSAIRHAINGWLCKMLGFLLLLGCAAGGISLLTWSAADPSLTHATGVATRNALGPIGAILADLLMQLLGLVGVWLAMICDELSRGLMNYRRWQNGAWRTKGVLRRSGA